MTVVDPRDPFPVGMRVLAVDDDPTCLMILETLLQKCQYHVTTTKNAIAALNLLRENKNDFDLVISDVHMPDMDGFKLLELVGLEMDLPVIMLSVNDDPKMVMKGITHGACDYLLKPVRIEALKNIWQHVIRWRKKKNYSKDQNKSRNQDKPDSGSCNEIGSASTGNSDQNGKHNKKRKDQDEDSVEDHENGHDNEEHSTQKKARVVWSVELHRKFVNAVYQLGIDKAVPKKILDLMNVENLTRENVASHLQKYRLYLKRTGDLANQQGNILGSTADESYLGITPLSGVAHFPTLSGSGQFHNNNGFRSFSPGGMISRLNTPSGLNLHGFPSSGTLQLNQAQNLNNSTSDQLQFLSALSCGGNQDYLSAGLDQWQHNKGVNSVQNLNTLFDVKPSFPASNRIKVTIGGSSSPILGVSNNALVLEPNPQGTQGSGIYENPTSVASPHSELSFPLLDHGRCSDIWSSSMQSPGTNSSYLSGECFRQCAISPTDNNIASSANFQGGNLSGASSITSLSNQSHDSLTDIHSQGLVFTNNPGQMSNSVPFQGWDGNNNLNAGYNFNDAIDPQGHAPSNSTFNRNMDFDFCDALQMKHDGVIDLTEEAPLKPLQMYGMSQQKSQNCCASNDPGSLEELVSEMMKQKHDKVKFSDGDFLSDNNYSGGTAK